MDFLLSLALLGLVVWVVWIICQPRCVFVVRVEGGRVQVLSGRATPAFQAVVREVCVEYRVMQATIQGLQHNKSIVLAFSLSIPPAAQQRLRNWWAHSGWSVRLVDF